MQARVLIAVALMVTIGVAVALWPQPQVHQLPSPAKPVAVEPKVFEPVSINVTGPLLPSEPEPEPENMPIGALERAD
jgi:hypothetical protein